MLPVAAALRYVRARRLIYGKAHMPLSAMTYVWDAENAPGNALHPSLRLYRGMQLSRIHPTSTLLLPVQKKEVRAMNSKKIKKGDRHWYDYL